MPGGPSEAVVTKFLRHALAGHALGVTELETKARAKGLLGERQSITTAKVFKRAKRSLGIRSLRAGFGARSQWRWQLPRQSEGSLKTDSGTARERRGAIPIDWVQGVAYLDPDRPPNDVPRHRWRRFVDDCKSFLTSPENLPVRAARLGWDAMAYSVVRPSGRSTILISPVCYGPSTEAGSLNCTEGGRNPPGELSIDPVADERLVRVTARVGAS